MGDSVKLETVITGTPTPKIEWAHNGSKISTTSGTMKMTEKDTIYSLVIDNVDQTFDGNYTVKAVNSSGNVQTSANLTVEGIFSKKYFRVNLYIEYNISMCMKLGFFHFTSLFLVTT